MTKSDLAGTYPLKHANVRTVHINLYVDGSTTGQTPLAVAPITKTLGSTSIRYRASDQYLIDGDPGVFTIWSCLKLTNWPPREWQFKSALTEPQSSWSLLVKLFSGKCHRTSLMTIQQDMMAWYRHAASHTWANVGLDLCHHMPWLGNNRMCLLFTTRYHN